MAEDLEELGFEDESPSDVTRVQWEQAQRDLITTTLDYNLQAIAGLVSDERIDLSPAYQRRDRWDGKRKSRLIESFLMNVPLPPVFLNEDEYGAYSIIDGKQRITAVSEFLTNKFELHGLSVFAEANGKTFSQLDPALQSVLQTRASLRAIILLRLSDPEIKYHVFQRLNTGGVRLNAQEVRNVTFYGDLNNKLISLAQLPAFQNALGIDSKNPSRSAIWNQMRDVELVLRYFTLRENWQKFKGSLAGAMNEWMIHNFKADAKKLRQLEKHFVQNVAAARAAFGPLTFRRLNPQGRPGNQRLATLVDAQMIATMNRGIEELEAHSSIIQVKMKALFADTDFQKAIGAQTNTAAFVRRRVEAVDQLVDEVLGKSK